MKSIKTWQECKDAAEAHEFYHQRALRRMTRPELTKLIEELKQKHNRLNAMEITSPCEGLMYVRFD